MEQEPTDHSDMELDNGISPNASIADKNLFQKIKSRIIRKVSEQGHNYNPEIGEFRASSMGYCSRKILLNKNVESYLNSDMLQLIDLHILDEDELPEPGSHMAGQVLHEYIQDALKDELEGIEEEVSIEFNGLRLVGHYDMLIKDEKGELVVIDIKSTAAKRDFLPVQAHLHQLMAYQGMMGGIRGALFYIHRNNWQMTYFSQDYDKNRFSQLLTKLSDLALHEKNRTLPPIDDEIFEIECKTDWYECQYFKFCFPDYVEPEPEKSNDLEESGKITSQ